MGWPCAAWDFPGTAAEPSHRTGLDHVLTSDKLETILRRLPRLTIGLIGDLFLDRYLHLVPGMEELSIETGLEAYQVQRVRNLPGALGTVISNLAALGVGMQIPVTAIGDDGHGYDLLKEIRRLPVDPSQILCLPDRLTPTYTKPLRLSDRAEWVELNRLDVRTRSPLPERATGELIRRLEEVFRVSDGLIVLDQLVDEECGVVNSEVRQALERLSRAAPEKLIYVDSRRHLGRFHFGTLKGNRGEVLGAGGDQPGSAAELPLAECLNQLSRRTGRPAFCTVGEQGILVAQAGRGEPVLAPAVAVSGPVDIVGAGDAATSGIVCALLAGMDAVEAAELGNVVASITIQQLGTTGTATPEQVLQRWSESQDGAR